MQWLLQNDEDEDRNSWQLIGDDASQAAITEALSADLGTLFGLRPTEQLAYRQMMQDPIAGPLHETYEGALRGTDLVLQDLDLTIYRGEYPTVTSSTDLLNGPRAVATSTNTRRLGRLLDLFLSAFLELLEEVCDPDHEQKPIEIHLVTNGLAGMCSGVERWQEWYESVASLDKDLADKIYMVPVVEPLLVDGIDDAALNSGSRTNAPGWTGYRHKYVQKNRLKDVLDCYKYNEAIIDPEAADAIAQAFEWDHLPSFDAFPQFASMSQADRDAYITQLREFVKAARAEGDWGESCLDEAEDERMRRRQTRRNKPMH